MGSGAESQAGNHFRPDPAVAAELENLMRDGGIDRVVRALQAEFEGHQDECPDSVAEAVSRLLLRSHGPKVDDVAAWIFTVARNLMVKYVERAKRLDALDGEHDEGFEDDAVVHETFRELAAIVDGWENARMKTITHLYLEAAFRGEPLSLREAAQLASAILHEEVAESSISNWKGRGLDRLRRELRHRGFELLS